MHNARVIAIDQPGVGNQFGTPNGNMLSTDLQDGAGYNFSGNRVAIA